MTTAVGAGDGRRHMILTAALAVAIVVVGGSAAGTLVQGAVSSAAPAPSVAVTPAPSTAAAPAAAPAPAFAAVAVDTAGRPLPPATRAGVDQLAAALASGDPAAVRPLYAARGVGAPWPQVAGLLGSPQTRDGLLAALRTAPRQRNGVYLYDANGYRAGVGPAGRLQFVQVP